MKEKLERRAAQRRLVSVDNHSLIDKINIYYNILIFDSPA